VTLSLVFVGYQIRQNTAAQTSATIEGIANQRVEFNVATWTDSEMPHLVRRFNEGAVSAEFTADEVQKGRLWLLTYLRIVEAAYRQVRVGVIGEDQTLRTFSSSIFAWPFFGEQWPILQQNFEPGFVSFFEAEFLTP